jgi:hypothetical protein
MFLTIIVGTIPLYLLLLSQLRLPQWLLRDVLPPEPSTRVGGREPSPTPLAPTATPLALATAAPTEAPTATVSPEPPSPSPTPPEPTSTATPTRQAPTARPTGTARPTPSGTATRPPTIMPPPEPRCQSAAGVVVPGTHFDIVDVSARPNQARDLIVEGVVRNNCDQPLRAVVRAEALNNGDRVIASGQARVGLLAPNASAPFRIDLGRAPGVARVRAVGELE